MTGLRGIRDDSTSMNGSMTISGQQKLSLLPDMTTKAIKEALTEILQSGTTNL